MLLIDAQIQKLDGHKLQPSIMQDNKTYIGQRSKQRAQEQDDNDDNGGGDESYQLRVAASGVL